MIPPPGLHVSLDRATYPIAGSTASHLRTILHTLGPTRAGRTFAAFTDWEIAWTYSLDPAAPGLRLASVRVDVRALVTLPRWRPPRSASAALVEHWQRYLAAVDLHEQGHVNLAVEAGRCVLTRLEALPAYPGADPLRRAVDAAAAIEIAAARDRESAYDEATSHGATQGATLRDDLPA